MTRTTIEKKQGREYRKDVSLVHPQFIIFSEIPSTLYKGHPCLVHWSFTDYSVVRNLAAGCMADDFVHKFMAVATDCIEIVAARNPTEEAVGLRGIVCHSYYCFLECKSCYLNLVG